MAECDLECNTHLDGDAEAALLATTPDGQLRTQTGETTGTGDQTLRRDRRTMIEDTIITIFSALALAERLGVVRGDNARPLKRPVRHKQQRTLYF
jgi:hypothetical protein